MVKGRVTGKHNKSCRNFLAVVGNLFCITNNSKKRKERSMSKTVILTTEHKQCNKFRSKHISFYRLNMNMTDSALYNVGLLLYHFLV